MEESTTANGLTTRWREKERLLGVTAGDMWESTRMTKNTGREHSSGLMEENTSESGIKANNTEEAPT